MTSLSGVGTLTGYLREASVFAYETGTTVYISQMPDGGIIVSPVIPAEVVYLRVEPDGSVWFECDACQRVKEENQEAQG